MRIRFSSLVVAAAVFVAVAPAHAASGTQGGVAGKILGMIPTHDRVGMPVQSGVHNGAVSGSGFGNLQYHSGGSVQTGTHTTYAIYWGTSFSANYASLINGFFQNVATDSGKTSNVYYSDTQYYQTISGVKTSVSYSEKFGDFWNDTNAPTTHSCSNTAGGTAACVIDTEVQAEVSRAIAAHPTWKTGQGSEFFVFLGDGISTCTDAGGSQCAFSQFCAYHSSYGTGAGTVLYANMPYTGHNLTSCGTKNYPNGDAAADSTINVTSHEANETITDYLGNAWYDYIGYENGDKCAWKFGTALGGGTGTQYNQVIGGAHYYLQGEYSNSSRGCVWSGK